MTRTLLGLGALSLAAAVLVLCAATSSAPALNSANSPAAASSALALDAVPWPAASNAKEPKPTEWDHAEPLRPTRVSGEHAPGCKVDRVRQWLRIRCDAMPSAAITQLTGDAQATRRSIGPEGADRMPGAGTLLLALTTGVRHVFTFWTFGPGYDGPLTVVPAVQVDVSWLEGHPTPTLLLSDALYEPVPTGRNPQ
jgi:hypothetical protein